MMSSTKVQLFILIFIVVVQNSDGYNCKKKFQVEHGYVDFDQMDEARGEVPVVCHTGYKAKPHKTMICRADGTWSGARCAPRDCKNIYKISKGKINYINTTYLSMNTVTCNLGYKLKGQQHITCQANEQWTTNTTCEQAKCIANFTIPHGFVEFKGKPTIYGSKFRIQCHEGYQSIGDNYTVCQANAVWTNATRCQPVDCGTNFTLENGYADFHKKDTIYKSRVQVYCRPGFNMRGNDYITCGINGTWSNDTECYPVECGTNHTISHSKANFTGRSSHYGTIVPVICDEGYAVSGNPYTECLATGKWSNTRCLLKDCGSKYIIENGKVDFERKNTKYKSKIPVKCNKGYALLGEKEITCQKNGRWSERTMCRLLDCGTVYPLENGYINFAKQKTTYKSKIPAECDSGYSVKGDSEIECKENGWTKKTSCSKGIFGEYTVEIFVGVGVGLFLILAITVGVFMKCKGVLCFRK